MLMPLPATRRRHEQECFTPGPAPRPALEGKRPVLVLPVRRRERKPVIVDLNEPKSVCDIGLELDQL
jgi:hypothetical protein